MKHIVHGYKLGNHQQNSYLRSSRGCWYSFSNFGGEGGTEESSLSELVQLSLSSSSVACWLEYADPCCDEGGGGDLNGRLTFWTGQGVCFWVFCGGICGFGCEIIPPDLWYSVYSKGGYPSDRKKWKVFVSKSFDQKNRSASFWTR